MEYHGDEDIRKEPTERELELALDADLVAEYAE